MIMSFLMYSISTPGPVELPTLPALLSIKVTTLADLTALPYPYRRFFEFFLVRIRNPHTRRAYGLAVRDFFAWLGPHNIERLDAIQPLHVSAWLDDLQAHLSIPTVKARLAAIRHLFDWLTAGSVVPSNPAHAVRGPAYSVERGKTPVLTPEEARHLLDSIDARTLVGLRDRALIATMVFSFARIGAVTSLTVANVFTQDRRLHLRLLEKRGTLHTMPCHHTLEAYLVTYMDRAQLWLKPDMPVFQTFLRSGQRAKDADRQLSGRALPQVTAWSMVRRRAKDAGIATLIGNHTFRATGITAYLKNGGTLERAKAMAAHRSARTTQLYDRRSDETTLDEVEKIQI
jgi:site-specific recombinase XerD